MSAIVGAITVAAEDAVDVGDDIHVKTEAKPVLFHISKCCSAAAQCSHSTQ